MEIGSASRPKPGEVECGDAVLVSPADDGTLVAVVDGVGHGPAAARVAQAACRALEDHRSADISALLRLCDRELAGTRGAAITLLWLDADGGDLVHAGIGNVELVSMSREPIRPITTPGIVGARFRRILETRHTVHPGDVVVVFTDGVSRRLELEELRSLPAQAAAEAILGTWAKDHDDATCVVLRA